MIFKGFILVNGYKLLPSVEYCAKRLQEEFSKERISLEIKKSTDIFSLIQDGCIKSLTSKYNFCIFLDKDYYISNMLEISGIHVFNNARAIELCDDKMKTYIALTNQGVPMPKTVSGPLNYSGVNNNSFLINLTKVLEFPIVVKENFGSQGSKVYLAKTYDELYELESKITSNPRLYQELIAESRGEDYRLIVIGNKLVAGMRRRSQNGDFRSNINLGGDAEKINVPNSYKHLAEKVSKLLNLDYCGIDILKSSKGPILCEVNSNAFFKKFEEVTNLNIAKIYKDHILSTLENENN